MMNFASVKARSAVGIHARPVSVEVHLSNGLPQFHLVGLPETAVKESKDRVRSAILNSYFDFPTRRITVNLAPADLPKVGSGFDLAIAIGILAASMQIPDAPLATHEFMGELALDGSLRRVTSIIPIVLSAHQAGNQIIIPEENAMEAALTQRESVFTAPDLKAVCAYLCQGTALNVLPPYIAQETAGDVVDWSDVKGQPYAKYALEIAAMGGHSVLMFGPPGSGKTMLARRFHTILPDLEEEKALEVAAIHSLKGKGAPRLLKRPPFRAPHHTSSTIALVGGGSPIKPGEISLAHQGVLFLDELPEFQRNVIETLREPLELGEISIARAAMQMDLPAQFQLIAAMNPCPCGEMGNEKQACICTPERINRYLSKLSSPFLDRIDMHLSIRPLLPELLVQPSETTSKLSETIREKVKMMQEKQVKRQGRLNAALTVKQCEAVCQLGSKELDFLRQVMEKYGFSARRFHRLLKVARTIADVRDLKKVSVSCLQEALSFKQQVK